MRSTKIKPIFLERITVSPKKGFITPKSETQREFIQSVRQVDIVLAIGPAGTGKTYLAVALAVEGLLKRQFKKIILVRPAVEAGEKLGFLPGDITEKINPYFHAALRFFRRCFRSRKSKRVNGKRNHRNSTISIYARDEHSMIHL